MGLEVILRPDALHRTRGDAGMTAHRADAPSAPACRRPRRLGDNARHIRRGDRRLAATPRLIGKPVQARRLKAHAPQRDALGRCVELLGDGLDPNAVEPAQDYLGALAIAHPDGGRARPPPKLRDDLGIRIQLLDRPWHLSNPPRDETTRSMLVGICGSGH